MDNQPCESNPLDIPPFLKRDANNKAEYMLMSEQIETAEAETPRKKVAPKVKAKAKAEKPVKAKAEKPKAKVEAKPAKAKAKATKESKAEKDQFGLRKGSAKSQAAAMYARKNGATLNEVKDVVGSIQLNVLNDLEAAGFKVERERIERKGQRPVTRYKLIPKK